MIPCLDTQMQQLQLFCRHKSNHMLSGFYQSVFKGQGMEFDDIRRYQTGDDVRAIDWRISARTGELHIKKFQEQRQLNLIFVVDASPSFFWSSTEKSRPNVAAELAAMLGSVAISNNDLVGLVRFGDDINTFIKPKRSQGHLLRCLTTMQHSIHDHKEMDLTEPLRLIGELNFKSSIVVLISNFVDEGFYSSEFENQLAALTRKHQVLSIALDDPAELNLPECGLVQLSDVTTGINQSIDSDCRLVRSQYDQNTQQRLVKRQSFFSRVGVDLLSHDISADPFETLLQYFQTRKQRVANETGG